MVINLSWKNEKLPSLPFTWHWNNSLDCTCLTLSFCKDWRPGWWGWNDYCICPLQSSSWHHMISCYVNDCRMIREGVKKIEKVLNYGWLGVKSPKLVNMWKYALFSTKTSRNAMKHVILSLKMKGDVISGQSLIVHPFVHAAPGGPVADMYERMYYVRLSTSALCFHRHYSCFPHKTMDSQLWFTRCVPADH